MTRGQVLGGAALVVALLGGAIAAVAILLPGEVVRHRARPGAEDSGADPFQRVGLVELHAGQRGPGLRLERLEGGRVTLDTWKDRLVVLNFWATWCTPCTVEMPALESLWRRYRGRGLVVVAVSVDRGAPRSLIEPYLRKLHLSFPVLLDHDMAAAQAWRVTGLPTTFVIRPGGDVAAMAVGARDWDGAAMRSVLEPMLPARPRTPVSGRSGGLAGVSISAADGGGDGRDRR